SPRDGGGRARRSGTPRPPSPWRRDRLRSRGRTGAWQSSHALHHRKFVAVEAEPDLLERLEHVGPRALRRALEAPADRLVLEVVQLAQHEGEPLLEGQAVHDTLEQRARLAEAPLLLGARGVDVAPHVGDPGIGAPPPAFGP